MNDAAPFSPSFPALAMAHSNYKVSEFIEQVDASFVRSDLESFWSCEPAFRRLLASSFAADMLKQELQDIAGDPVHVGDWQPGQLMVHRGSGFALSLSLFETSRRYVHTTPYYAMYAPVGQVALHYDIYRLPENYLNAVFDPAQRLERAGSGVTAPGEVLQLQSRQYAYDFRIDQPLLVAKFTTAPFHTLEWLFSKETLRAWQANDSELTATQLRVAAYLLGRLAHQSSLEPLLLLTTHANHAVRWAAIQGLGRLSRTEAMAKLELAQNDPHPHVRRAAAKTLRQLKEKI